MKVVSMEQKHMKQISKIERLCFADPWSDTMLSEEQKNANTRPFVAIMSGKIIGFAFIRVILDEAELLQIAITPREQGKGYAKVFLSHILEELQNSIRILFLEVRSQNIWAIQLYKSLNFEKISVRTQYYSNPTDHAEIYQFIPSLN